MLSHLLARSGIDNVAIDTRPRQEIETTHRAGIAEDGVVKTIVESGVGDRVHTDGNEHHGIELRFDRAEHRIDFGALVNASCWLYPQTDVLIDLANARDRDGGDVRFRVTDTWRVPELGHGLCSAVSGRGFVLVEQAAEDRSAAGPAVGWLGDRRSRTWWA
jgi:hypothetical protein